MLEKLLKIDRKIYKLGIRLSYNKQRNFVIISIVILNLRIISSWILTITQLYKAKQYVRTIPVIIYHVIGTSVPVQYVIPMLLIKQRFKALNGELQLLQKDCENDKRLQERKIPKRVPLKNIKITLREINTIRTNLMDVAHLYNYIFQIQLLFKLSSLYVGLNYVMFYIIRTLITNESKKHVVIRLFHLLFDLLEITLIGSAANLTTDEVNNTAF